ncbi:MAG: N-acetylglucosamine-6-phosphate deacetylase [Acidobacteria bacterium]|nr:MAG: N-acetylglucosamine-6-phosphate deacetylase [Acidobacteriota bacterium]
MKNQEHQPRGFVDLQVNGYLGIDFSSSGLTVQKVREVVERMRERGTVGFCPTVITSSLELYENNLPVLARSLAQADLASALLGIHLEGPFISPEDGARGAHPVAHVQPPSVRLLDQLRKLAKDRISLLTVAPEQTGALALIEYAVKSGITVSLGHHRADTETIRRACDVGAQASTHLGNGISNLLPRHPNQIWDQLDEERLTAMLITDGHHLPASFIRVVAKVKGASKLIVVSDAAPLAGFPPGKYECMGQQVVLEEGGRIWNPVGQHLVGSSACLLECMNHLAGLGVFREQELWQVGFHNPLGLLKVKDFKSPPDVRVVWRNDRFEVESR